MMRRYETTKSIILTILIAVSCLLTWSIWTYQPKDEFIDKKNVHEVSISEQVDAVNLIKPVKVLIHLKGEHYGTVDDNEVDKLINEISAWNFYDIEDAKIYDQNQLQELSHSDNKVEIVYPDLVPFDLYKGVIHVETKEMPNAGFNRIVINLANQSKEDASVYFIATDQGKVYESHINPDRLTTFLAKIEMNKNRYDEYGINELSNGRLLFLPIGERELEEYTYYTDNIDPERFKNALFSDPSRVRRDIHTNGDKYTDGSSLLDVDHRTNMIFYVNPGHEWEPKVNGNNVLKKSIDFVNEHGGWTDNYRYFNLGLYERRITFQLFVKGHPVFNEQGMSEILHYWGTDEIYQYRRPYFTLDIPLPGQKMVMLPTGEEALNYLLFNDGFDSEMLEDLLIGYKLSKDPNNPKVLILEPSWYYLYAGSWLRLASEDIRGDYSGLE